MREGSSALFYPLSLFWLFWCPRMWFKDNQSFYVDCIMNPLSSSFPKPPRSIQKPSPVCLALNTVVFFFFFLTPCLMQSKYSVNSCWTNEYISLLNSWISLYSSLIIHLFIHPFVQQTHIRVVPWNFAWVKQDDSDCLYPASRYSEYKKGAKTLYQSVITTTMLCNNTTLKLNVLKWQSLILTETPED